MNATAVRWTSARRQLPVGLVVLALAALFALSGFNPTGVTGAAHAIAPSSPAAALPTSSPVPALHPPTLPHSVAPSAASTSARAPTHGAPGAPAPGGSGAPPVAPPTLAASGRGTFFTSTSLPLPANASLAYPYGSPINDTTSPSIAVSAHGDAVLAYTAYTNESPCANSTPFAMTEIGLVATTNNGSTWSSPNYLGNPDCSAALNYTSAWQPSVAVLGNGTFAMAYVEYNASFGPYPDNLPDDVSPSAFYYDQVVISYSYDNGTTWTNPYAINSSVNLNLSYRSSLPELPVLAATGQTLYLLWENYTNPYFYYEPSVGLNMVVSNDSGATWGLPITFPVQVGLSFGEYYYADNNPSVVISPSGELFVAYTTNYSEATPPNCQLYACSNYYFDTLNVVVASSVNNGSTLHVHTVAHGVPWFDFYPGDSFVATAPQIAYDAASGRLYVAYLGMMFPTSCFTYPQSTGCYIDAPAPWISVSTNHGTTWSVPRAVSFILDNPYGGVYDLNADLGLAINATGAVFISELFQNDSVCVPFLFGGTTCGLDTEVMLISTDGGGNFTGPYTIATGNMGNEYWLGLTSTFATLAGNLTAIWANPSCPGFASYGYCYWGGGTGYVNITLSQEYTGTGVTVTFNETGLPTGLNWTATLSGNARSGPSGTNLTVSGVPAGPGQVWSANWLNTTYGHAFGVTLTPPSPGAITASTAIVATYDPYVLLNIFTVPPAQSGQPFACNPLSGFGDECGNQAIAPTAGAHWEPLYAPLIYNVTPGAWPGYCYLCYNYSFLSWTGSGLGSWNSTNPNGTSVLGGPVNETASFSFISTCSNFFGSVSCQNATYDYLFQETGLPANTTWAVTLGSQTEEGMQSSLLFTDGQGPYNFTIWSVPYNATLSWVGTPSYPSPITSLQGATETVHFLLVADSSLSSGVTFGARGLPAGVPSWGLLLNGTSYGVPLTNSTFVLPSGNYTLNATDVYGANDIGAYLSEFLVTPLAVNATQSSVLPGGSVHITGATQIIAVFSPEYFVGVSWSTGGTVNPGYVGWTHSGVSEMLTA
ncbi:MAG: glycoside hydrolase, partial [Thermoplasmata archaeon]|nr:glycoside hydrolase [Thermoplasmata archaeon]